MASGQEQRARTEADATIDGGAPPLMLPLPAGGPPLACSYALKHGNGREERDNRWTSIER
jgi:hypothetical protein